MGKVYQVIMQDEYDNLYLLGFYRELKDSIVDINDFLSVYGVKISADNLKEYAGTFDECFDLSLGDLFEGSEEVQGLMIRGFIFDQRALLTEIESIEERIDA